ncbi:hypothetical protein AB0H07_10910 [Streptomyces sp. NPDC021354]|uniref:hypothetical protein n=1 Tax=Streptomyces sp. NPDC021354 TaxID=3154793 RepID=UPI00340E4C9C
MLMLPLAAACSAGRDPYGRTVTEGQLIGHWKGDCGATIDMAGDGTARFDKFAYEFVDRGRDFRRFSGDGEWFLEEGVGEDDPQYLSIRHKRALRELEFIRDGDGDGLGLRYLINVDHERDCLFSKKPAASKSTR